MNLVDSSGWLEYFSDGKNAKYFAPIIENTDELIVSVINIYEIYKKILIEKDEGTAINIIGVMHQARIVALDNNIAIQAAKYSVEYKLPFADSIIYATAQMNSAIVWTQDSDFKELRGVKYFKK